jgi:hypothetical protein
MEQFVKPVQIQVRQQRRNHSALRRPFLIPDSLSAGVCVSARFHHWRLQPLAQQTQYTAVHYALAHTRQQLLVRNRIEVRLQIRVIHLLIPGL